MDELAAAASVMGMSGGGFGAAFAVWSCRASTEADTPMEVSTEADKENFEVDAAPGQCEAGDAEVMNAHKSHTCQPCTRNYTSFDSNLCLLSEPCTRRYKIQVSETLSETLHFHSPRHHQAWATSPGHGVSETLTRLSGDPYPCARADGSRSRLTGWPCARRHGVWRRPAAFTCCCKQQSLGQPLCRPRTLHANPRHGHELRASTIIATSVLPSATARGRR